MGYPSPFDLWWPNKQVARPSATTTNPGANLTPLNYVSSGDAAQPVSSSIQVVQFPRNSFVPEGARELDYQRIVVVEPQTSLEDLLTFVADESAKTVITHFATFTDALYSDMIEFRPMVDSSRVFIHHGNPMDDGRIRYSTGQDLTQNALRPASQILNAGQVMAMKVSNFGDVPVVMGVRFVGYVLPTTA